MGVWDDVAYVVILVVSIGLGKMVRLIPPEIDRSKTTFRRRKLVSTILGLTIALLVSGWHVTHLFVQIAGNAVILLALGPRQCHMVSFFWCFSYLFFFRLSPSFGLPSPPPHTNAIMLILTLKLVGLAFEVHDEAVEKETKIRDDTKEAMSRVENDDKEVIEKSESVVPHLGDQIHYCLNHVGLIAGPYYRYSTWRSMYLDPWNPAVNGKPGVCEAAALARIRLVPLYVVVFLVSGYLFPLSVVDSDHWQESHGLVYKIFYMAPIFFTFRMRIYAGFCLSEVVCIMAGLGAYPASSKPKPGQGPSLPVDYKEHEQVNFEAVHNINEWGVEFAPSMREALRYWNMTVQYWLVSVVYKRFPLRSLRTTAVMLVSSVWHGVHPGYYLGLGSVPIFLVVEDIWRNKVRARLSPRAQGWYDWGGWIVRMRWFEYLGMAFLLLRIDSTMTYWHSVNYCGHISLVFFLIIAQALGPILDQVFPKVKQDLTLKNDLTQPKSTSGDLTNHPPQEPEGEKKEN